MLASFALAGRGAAPDARVASLGGTVVAGSGGMEAMYWNMRRLAGWLARTGVTANGLTWASLVLGIGAGALFAVGFTGCAALALLGCGVLDMLDGLVARAQGTASDAGEAFDLAVDRFCEEAAFAGVIWLFRGSALLLVLTIAAAAGAGMVTLSSAKAEALQVTVRGGLMRRHERVTLLVAGGILGPICVALFARLGVDAMWATLPLAIAIGLLAVLGNLAAVRRFRAIAVAVRARERAAADR